MPRKGLEMCGLLMSLGSIRLSWIPWREKTSTWELPLNLLQTRDSLQGLQDLIMDTKIDIVITIWIQEELQSRRLGVIFLRPEDAVRPHVS